MKYNPVPTVKIGRRLRSIREHFHGAFAILTGAEDFRGHMVRNAGKRTRFHWGLATDSGLKLGLKPAQVGALLGKGLR